MCLFALFPLFLSHQQQHERVDPQRQLECRWSEFLSAKGDDSSCDRSAEEQQGGTAKQHRR